MVLLAVLRCGDDAYGVSVQDELVKRTGRRIVSGAVYVTLDRLEAKGLLKSSFTAPTAERGGRAKRCYTVTKSARAALLHSRRALGRLWEGLELMEES